MWNYNWPSSAEALSDSVQAVSHGSCAGFPTKKAMWSSNNEFIFHEICDKTIPNQTFHNSGAFRDVVGWTVICRVTACALCEREWSQGLSTVAGECGIEWTGWRYLPTKVSYHSHPVRKQSEVINWVKSGSHFWFLPWSRQRPSEEMLLLNMALQSSKASMR